MPIFNPGKSFELQLVDAEVFSGASPNPEAWTDLDISAVVGPNPALVLLRFYNANAGVKECSMRRNGETEFSTRTRYGYNSAYMGGTDFGLILCETDVAGILEWKYDQVDQANITIDVIAFARQI